MQSYKYIQVKVRHIDAVILATFRWNFASKDCCGKSLPWYRIPNCMDSYWLDFSCENSPNNSKCGHTVFVLDVCLDPLALASTTNYVKNESLLNSCLPWRHYFAERKDSVKILHVYKQSLPPAQTLWDFSVLQETPCQSNVCRWHWCLPELSVFIYMTVMNRDAYLCHCRLQNAWWKPERVGCLHLNTNYTSLLPLLFLWECQSGRADSDWSYDRLSQWLICLRNTWVIPSKML